MLRMTVIKRFWAATLVACAAFVLSATPARAATIGVRYDMTLDLLAGLDTLGLDGASASFVALFDDSIPYGNVGGLARAFTTFDSLTISGATVASSNGTFSSVTAPRFFPSFVFEGQFFGNPGFLQYNVGAVPLMIGHLATAVPGVNPGDFLDASHFGTTAASLAISPGCVFCASADTTLEVVTDSRYGVSSFSATAVPEPATLTLLAIGLATAARRRRRTE